MVGVAYAWGWPPSELNALTWTEIVFWDDAARAIARARKTKP